MDPNANELELAATTEPHAWEPGEIPGLLCRLLTGHFSGLATLSTASGRQVALRFALGELIGSASFEELASRLLARGRLGEADLSRAAEVARRDRRRLSAVVHELFAVDHAELRDAVARAVQSDLAGVLSATGGAWTLTPGFGPASVEEEVALDLPTRELILGACRAADTTGVLFHIGDPGRVPEPTGLPCSSRLRLSAEERFLLSRTGEGLPLGQVLSLAPPGCEAEGILLGLACTGLIHLDAPRPERPLAPAERRRRDEIQRVAARLQHCTPYELLGVAPGASRAEIREAYGRAVKRFHPDAAGAELSDLRPELQRIVGGVVAAYRSLGAAPSPRPETPAPVAPAPVAPAPAGPAFRPPGPAVETPVPREAPAVEAVPAGAFVEDGLLQARALHGNRRFWEAIQLLDALEPSAVGDARFHARLLRAQCYAQNPMWRHLAERELVELSGERPRDAEVAFQLGRIYATAGLRLRAVSAFRRALRSDPGHARARWELAGLDAEHPASGASRERVRGGEPRSL